MVSEPKIKLAFIPYYCVLPTTVTECKAKFLQARGGGGGGNEEIWKEISLKTTTTHEDIVVYGSTDVHDGKRDVLQKVEYCDMEASIPVLELETVVGDDTLPTSTVS